jgi:hypothetical protein
MFKSARSLYLAVLLVYSYIFVAHMCHRIVARGQDGQVTIRRGVSPTKQHSSLNPLSHTAMVCFEALQTHCTTCSHKMNSVKFTSLLNYQSVPLFAPSRSHYEDAVCMWLCWAVITKMHFPYVMCEGMLNTSWLGLFIVFKVQIATMECDIL